MQELCATCPALNGNAGSTGTKNGSSCGGSCSRSSATVKPVSNLELTTSDGVQWIKVTDLKSTFETVKRLAANKIKYRVVAGNTGTGNLLSPPFILKSYCNNFELIRLKS